MTQPARHLQAVHAEVVPMPERWLTIDELAALLRIHPRTIERWKQRFRGTSTPFPCRQRGGKVFYRLSAVEAWEQEVFG